MKAVTTTSASRVLPPVTVDSTCSPSPRTTSPANPSGPVVAVGQQIIGMIESNSDKDWIGVDLTAGRNYRITVSGSYGDIGGRSFTIYTGLESKVYNNNGQTVNLGNRFRMENANTDHGGNVGYLVGRIVSARWTNVATSGRYFFQVQQSSKKRVKKPRSVLFPGYGHRAVAGELQTQVPD